MKFQNKKVGTKLVALALGAVSAFSMASCFGNGGGNESGAGGGGNGLGGNLKISVARLGYGIEWLEALEKEFEKETGINVKIVSKVGNTGVAALQTEAESLASDTDLFFNRQNFFAKKVYEGAITVKGATYDCLYADLSDVWDSVVDEGSTATIKDKMNASYEQSFNIAGKYYAMPWAGGVMGMARNVTVWDSLGLTADDVPLTTDQMFALCDRIKSQKAPFIFCMDDNYVEPFMNIWTAQYEGVANWQQFLEGKDPDGNVTEHIFSYDGFLEMLEVVDKWVSKDSGYHHSKCDAVDFTQMQGLFLKNEALFCVNGTWLENEMRNLGTTSTIDYIRTPVISSIIDKLDTVNTDAQLAEVIKYIDAVDAGNTSAVKPDYVSDADLKAVTEARHYSFTSGGDGHQAYIPSYAKNIAQAKEFLKFMYSDKGLNIYYKTLNGATLPAQPVGEYDASVTPSAFMASSNAAFRQGYVVNFTSNVKYFNLTGISMVFNQQQSALKRMYNGESAKVIYNDNVAISKVKFNSSKDAIIN